jgi:hypothetical protein
MNLNGQKTLCLVNKEIKKEIKKQTKYTSKKGMGQFTEKRLAVLILRPKII